MSTFKNKCKKILAKVWSWIKSAYAWLRSEDAKKYIKIVEDTVENSDLINQSKYQKPIREVIALVKDAAEYSSMTDDQKKEITFKLAKDKLENYKLSLPDNLIKMIIDILYTASKDIKDKVDQKIG